ncbi:MAG TPA: hypothetical protein PLW65_04025 [Pseudomonadota bacterium]|nr:hypothetical protein [Pseudomonadota bacterium]
MKRQSRELLANQLQQVLSAYQQDPGDPFEIAVLAGLLARDAGDSPAGGDTVANALAEARRLQASSALQAGLPSEEVAIQMVDRVCAISELDSEAERADALLDLDELSAGSWFLGAAQHYAAQLDEAASAIRAFPSLWRALAPWASRVLAEAPPLPGDPAVWMWQALESCQFPTETIAPPACDTARRALGIPLMVSRSTAVAPRPTLHAASDLPPESPVHALAKGEGFELGLGVGADGQSVLIVSCSATPELFHAGQPRNLQQRGAGLYLTPALPGQYRLVVGSEELHVEVTD